MFDEVSEYLHPSTYNIYIYIYTQKKGKMSNLRMDNINYVSSPSGTQSKNQKTSNETN